MLNDLVNVEKEFQKLLQIPQIQALLPRSPNMRYWENGNYIYAWTTERVKGKFYALRYRVRKDGSWTLKQKAKFGKRRVAKARARKWLQNATRTFLVKEESKL